MQLFLSGLPKELTEAVSMNRRATAQLVLVRALDAAPCAKPLEFPNFPMKDLSHKGSDGNFNVAGHFIQG